MVQHPLDTKNNVSFYLDRLVHAKNPDEHETLVTAIEQYGTLARSVYTADVVLVDPTMSDLTTLADVRGTLVSYRYVENCVFFCKRLSFGQYVVELPTQTARAQASASPVRPFWRYEATPQLAERVPADRSRSPKRSDNLETAASPQTRNFFIDVPTRARPLPTPSDSPKAPAALRAERGGPGARPNAPRKSILRAPNTGAAAGDDSDKPPTPTFPVPVGERVELWSSKYFPWCLAYTKWATLVRPQIRIAEISQHVYRIIPGIAPSSLMHVYNYKTYKVQSKKLDLAQADARQLAKRRGLKSWSVARLDAAVSKLATDYKGERDTSSSPAVLPAAPRPPPPDRLVMEGRHRTEEAKTWMQEYFRWHLRREDRPSVEGLSKEMREKTGGLLAPSTFVKYRQENRHVFDRIEKEYEREKVQEAQNRTKRRASLRSGRQEDDDDEGRPVKRVRVQSPG